MVHAGYLEKLKYLHPNLSDIELKHCIFIKLHMEAKEVASLLNVEPRSVATSKYRIKKKLQLTEAHDLKDYLLSV
ncbi:MULTISPECIES: helix-turn-helix transcriptional regulator [unclassified Carboxylicivirga]|uniref:helix-turn-helix transcriptional regulator n=1 Tax=Carboxylicivirga TaxID=1628153 RepID=UPI003D337889